MARDEAPPFARGETFYGGVAKESIFADPLNYLGKEYVFEVNAQDQQTGYPLTTDNTGRLIRVRVVQNKSGAKLLPKKIAKYKLAAGVPLGTQVDGYTFAAGDYAAGVIDEYLPPAGVAADDLFYLVVEGPTTVLSASANAVALAIGDQIKIGAGTSILHADAGRVVELASPALVPDIQDQVGRSEAAVITNDAAVAACVKFRSYL